MSKKDKEKLQNKASNSTSNINPSNKTTASNPKKNQQKNNPKKLNLANINKLSSKFNEKKKVIINIEGEQYEFMINTVFRRSEVEKACLEFLELLAKTLQIKGIDEKELMGNIESFLQVFILKHFTNIPIPEVDDISKLLNLTKNLYNLGILDELFINNSEIIGEDNFKLVSETYNKVASDIGKVASNKVIMSELANAQQNRIDVDDYFSELELRNFDIAEDEDLELLPKVIDQLNKDGLYEEYMSKLTSEEIEKLNERFELLKESEGEQETNEGV